MSLALREATAGQGAVQVFLAFLPTALYVIIRWVMSVKSHSEADWRMHSLGQVRAPELELGIGVAFGHGPLPYRS